MSVSRLLRVPLEILENIALELALGDLAVGPPAQLVPFLSTCRHVYDALSYTRNSSLYMRIFELTFDTDAVRRRLGPEALHAPSLSSQLRTYCSALQRIRHGDIHTPTVLEDFWTLLFLAFEDDGKNRVQLEWAQVGSFADRFVRARLWEGQQHGWPIDSPINALALWLLWTSIGHEALMSQNPAHRQELVDLILPYVVMAFKYPAFYAPDNHFNFPLPEDLQTYASTTVNSVHGAYPHYHLLPPENECTHTHYGQQVVLRAPPLPAAAKLLYFAIREAVPLVVPEHLPLERAPGYVGQTQADVMEVNAHQCALLRPASSMRFDAEWARMRRCFDPWAQLALQPKGTVYRPGLMSGLWQGRLLVPDLGGYLNLLTTRDRPVDFSEMNPWMSTWPMFVRLREHRGMRAVGIGGDPGDRRDEGIRNAWYPSVTVHHDRDGVMIVDDEGNRTEHKTVRELQHPSHADYEGDFAYAGLPEAPGIQNIVFTGETDANHSLAWGRYNFLGRVRAWDGLIALVRIPADAQARAGRWVFRGYLHGDAVLAGSWRAMTTDVGSVPWEGAFVVSKRA